MSLRDKFLTILSLLLTALGVVFTLLWNMKFGLVMALALGLLLCLLLVLQRKQMSLVQQRLLRLTKLVEQLEAEPDAPEQHHLILYKRLLGHLQSQQITMEILHQKLDEISDARQSQ